MLDWHIKPNQNTHVVMMRGSRWDTVLYHNRILEERRWFSCISLSVFIDSCGYNDQFEAARLFWIKIRAHYRDLMTTNVYTSMIEACGRCGALAYGCHILAQYEEAAPELEQTVSDRGKLYQTFETQIIARQTLPPSDPFPIRAEPGPTLDAVQRMQALALIEPNAPDKLGMATKPST